MSIQVCFFPSFNGSVDNKLEADCVVKLSDKSLKVMPVTMNVVDACCVQRD